MIDLTSPFRRGTAADAPALAEFINAAGEGLPVYLWRQMAGPGEDPWEIGRRNQARKAEDGKVFVIDEGDGAVAGLMGYPIPADPEPIAEDELPAIVPLLELEALAPSTWYVNVLAAAPEHQGRGLGSRLLGLAEDLARDLGLGAMSIIVASGNADARRLYARTGYAEVARRPIVKNGWSCDSDEWVLLVKPL